MGKKVVAQALSADQAKNLVDAGITTVRYLDSVSLVGGTLGIPDADGVSPVQLLVQLLTLTSLSLGSMFHVQVTKKIVAEHLKLQSIVARQQSNSSLFGVVRVPQVRQRTTTILN